MIRKTIMIVAIIFVTSLLSCSERQKVYSCDYLTDYYKNQDTSKPESKRFIDSCNLVNAKLDSIYIEHARQARVLDSVERIENAQKAKEQQRQEDSLAKSPYGKHQKMLQNLTDKLDCTIDDAERAYDAKTKGRYFVEIGMSISLLKYMRGLPNSVNISDYGNGREYQACWHGDATMLCVYYGEDGIIRVYN